MPYITITDSNDRVYVDLPHPWIDPPRDPTFEADLVAWLKARLATQSGVGEITARKFEQVTTVTII